MRSQLFATLSLLAMLKPVLGTWRLDSYKSGCPADSETAIADSTTAGDSEDEIWCHAMNPAHNMVATGIEADGMVVSLFSDLGCTAFITDFDTDGCKVIPSDTDISAARILPK